VAHSSLRELQLRLRAEEVRAIAGEMTVDENRLVFERIAADYERLAQCAKLISDSRLKLARLDTACASPGNDQCPPPPGDKDRINTYREMAADALALAGAAAPATQDRWSVLAQLWTTLAEDIESRTNAQSS
jgi:hypothetical protein